MDVLTKDQRHKNMSNIRSKNTKPEKLFARRLREAKIYCTRNDKRIFGKPDFVFRRKKVVVFIDSEFWHGHPEKCRIPATNTEFWVNKIERNKGRDASVTAELEEKGWKVLRFWVRDVMKNTEVCLEKLLESLNTVNSAPDGASDQNQELMTEYLKAQGPFDTFMELEVYSFMLEYDFEMDNRMIIASLGCDGRKSRAALNGLLKKNLIKRHPRGMFIVNKRLRVNRTGLDERKI